MGGGGGQEKELVRGRLRRRWGEAVGAGHFLVRVFLSTLRAQEREDAGHSWKRVSLSAPGGDARPSRTGHIWLLHFILTGEHGAVSTEAVRSCFVRWIRAKQELIINLCFMYLTVYVYDHGRHTAPSYWVVFHVRRQIYVSWLRMWHLTDTNTLCEFTKSSDTGCWMRGGTCVTILCL